MKPYFEFRPTSFDCRGAFLPDQQDWLVAPVSQNRDSDPLSESNFACALEALGGESETVQVHRFGHWGPGWFELILIDPSDAKSVKTGEELEASLSNYPILDGMDYLQREWERAESYWNSESIRWRWKSWLEPLGLPILAARKSLSRLCQEHEVGDLISRLAE